jgi:hypothetical protein
MLNYIKLNIYILLIIYHKLIWVEDQLGATDVVEESHIPSPDTIVVSLIQKSESTILVERKLQLMLSPSLSTLFQIKSSKSRQKLLKLLVLPAINI